MSDSNAATSAGGARISRRTVQIVLGIIWLIDGLLQFQPFMFSRDFLTQIIAPMAQGQPQVVGGPIVFAIHVVQPILVPANAVFAMVQVLIGLGLIVSRRTVKPALAVSFVWAIIVWWFGEGFGMLTMGMASPLTGAPGAVILYLLIGLMVWPTDRQEGPSAAAGGPLGDLGGRIVWAAVWLLFAVLMFLPANFGADTISQTLKAAAGSAQGPLVGLDTALGNATADQGVWLGVLLALIMAVIALGVLFDLRRNAFLIAGFVLTIVFWLTTEFIGGLPSGSATDPNTGPLLVLLGLAVYRWSAVRSAATRVESVPRPELQS